jgi:hypothetical protein
MSTARLLAEFGGETAIVRRLAYRILRAERDERERRLHPASADDVEFTDSDPDFLAALRAGTDRMA